MKAKKQSALSRLMKIAGKHKYFSYASCVLAAISAWVALIPFYDVAHHKGGLRSKTGLFQSNAHHIVWMAGGRICPARNGALYRSFDVLS